MEHPQTQEMKENFLPLSSLELALLTAKQREEIANMVCFGRDNVTTSTLPRGKGEYPDNYPGSIPA